MKVRDQRTSQHITSFSVDTFNMGGNTFLKTEILLKINISERVRVGVGVGVSVPGSRCECNVLIYFVPGLEGNRILRVNAGNEFYLQNSANVEGTFFSFFRRRRNLIMFYAGRCY